MNIDQQFLQKKWPHAMAWVELVEGSFISDGASNNAAGDDSAARSSFTWGEAASVREFIFAVKELHASGSVAPSCLNLW
jgi:hypothetical protein